MFGQLYIVPFTNTLVLAKDTEDAKTVTAEHLQFIRDVKSKREVWVESDGKRRVRLKNDYLGRTVVTATSTIRGELGCL